MAKAQPKRRMAKARIPTRQDLTVRNLRALKATVLLLSQRITQLEIWAGQYREALEPDRRD
jgi:hypothetical protein